MGSSAASKGVAVNTIRTHNYTPVTTAKAPKVTAPKASEAWNMALTPCLNYIPIALIKHQDQDNSQKKGFKWAHSFGGSELTIAMRKHRGSVSIKPTPCSSKAVAIS